MNTSTRFGTQKEEQTSKNSSKEAISEEEEEELDDEDFEDSNNVGSYRLESGPTAVKAAPASPNAAQETMKEEGEVTVLKRNYSDGAICLDDLPKGLSPEEAQTLKQYNKELISSN